MRGVSFPAARALAYDVAEPLDAHVVPLRDAVGCALAQPLRALVDLPSFDTAAMDGWAVRGRGPWRVVGRVLAGARGPSGLREGEAVEVATGAGVPGGADAVIRSELGVVREGRVVAGSEQSRHIRRAGEECREGTLLLPAGATLSAAGVGLAAAVGHDTLLVHATPRVHALITGDELLQWGRPQGARIRDAIGPMLDGVVSSCGGTLVGLEHLPDDGPQLAKAIDAADADVVVTTGASSVGPADFLPFALAELGAHVLVDGVRVRPGHPQVLARLSTGELVVGVPGNPLAALAALLTLLAPVLAGLAGKPRPAPRQAMLSHAVTAADRDHRLVPVAAHGGRVAACEHAGSAMLRGAALADGLAVIPPRTDLEAGAGVEVISLLA